MTKLDWITVDIGECVAHCADGDGIVVVKELKGDFGVFGVFGVFVANDSQTRYAVFEQGDLVASYKTAAEAFALAEQILHADYPVIYADCLA